MPHAEEIVRTDSGQALERSSRGRAWLILCLLFFLTVIMFIARQALSVMAPVLRTVFHLSNAAYGRIVSALGFGMMTGEFPMGYLMDRLGARLGLTAAICWWSTATGSFALASSGLTLGLSQFWKGTGECAAYSGGVKTVTRLFEKKDRTLAIGIFNGGSVIGATLAVPVIVYLLEHYGFRVAFLVPSISSSNRTTPQRFASTSDAASNSSPRARNCRHAEGCDVANDHLRRRLAVRTIRLDCGRFSWRGTTPRPRHVRGWVRNDATRCWRRPR